MMNDRLRIVPLHTYSIVALDPNADEMGAAVQSHWFNVGSIVPWARSGVGVVATQALTNVSFGPKGLSLMEGGRSPADALAALLQEDEGRENRQVALLDVDGNVSAHTGSLCIREAGHHTGKGYSVQANMMLRDAVWPAMAEAFEASGGSLARRMLSALLAAEKEGGDIRGRQSAALKVVHRRNTGAFGNKVDLRVEDHESPLAELRRLLGIHEGYDSMNRADVFLEQNKSDDAVREYQRAAALIPDNPEPRYWHAVSLANLGRLREAVTLFQAIFAESAGWRELTPRIRDAGLLKISAAELSLIMG